MKGTGWVGLELSVILTQTVGRFDRVTPYTGILTLGKLKYFMSKNLSTKTRVIDEFLVILMKLRLGFLC